MKAMAMKAFNVPNKDDGDDGDDFDDGEENGDGDGDDEKDRGTVALTLARHRWSIRPASRDKDGNKGNGDEVDCDEGL